MLMRTAVLLGLMTVSVTVSADVYRWVDSQGRVQYSDRPSAEGAERLAVVSRRSDPAVIAQRNEAAREQYQQSAADSAQRRRDTATAQAVRQDVAKSREEQCKEAKERYRLAVESQKLYRVGKDGERQYLTSAEIDEARMNARRAMDEACGPAS